MYAGVSINYRIQSTASSVDSDLTRQVVKLSEELHGRIDDEVTELTANTVAREAALDAKLTTAITGSMQQLYTHIEEERLHAAQRLDGSVRALHCIQKLMGRPDGADIFQEFDTDGDGQISREELRAGFAKIGEELSEADIDAIMTLADTDGDGTIDTNEFVQMGKMTKEVEAMSKTMIAGLDALSVRLDDEVVGMTSSMTSIVSSVGADLQDQLAAEIADLTLYKR